MWSFEVKLPSPGFFEDLISGWKDIIYSYNKYNIKVADLGANMWVALWAKFFFTPSEMDYFRLISTDFLLVFWFT